MEKKKIFHGGSVYEVTTQADAYEIMYQIARSAQGTFEGCQCSETGFWVDAENPVCGGILYPVKGCKADQYYAETNDKTLFED